jgi:hypothetical protein
MNDTNELIDETLTPEERAADASAVAAGFDPMYHNLAAEKMKKANSGNRKKKDRRFKVNALDDAPDASASANDVDDPWDSKVPVFEEVRRIGQIVHTYCVQGAVMDTFRPAIDKQAMIKKVFDGRKQTTARLKKLYDFMQTRYSNGGRCLVTSPLYWLVQSILVNEKAIEQPPPEKLSAVFDNVFADCPAVVGEAR